jgi:YggT family protein
LIILSCGELLKLATYVIIFSIFARAILSWFNPSSRHPMSRLLGSFTEPLLSPARRLIPATGGLDLAPVIVFIVLTMFLKLIAQPLLDLGRELL